MVLLGIENFEVYFTGKNVIMTFQKRLFLTHLTFLNGCQAAKKKDDSPSLLIRLKIRFLLSILLKIWCCELLTSTTPKYGLSNYFKTGKSGSKKVELTFPSHDSSRAQSTSLGIPPFTISKIRHTWELFNKISCRCLDLADMDIFMSLIEFHWWGREKG